MTAHYDAALEPVGLNLAQYSLIKNIKRHGPISLTALADIVELDRSTLGRNVRVLERMGFVALEPGPDKREAMLVLTDLGRTTLERAMPLWRAVQSSLRSRLGADGAIQLEALLSAL
jgi:DNA-binding MarR family transcriptional regulator